MRVVPALRETMDVDVLDAQAYALRLGRFGNFGFEVEPTIGLRLLPQQQGTYAITTEPVPGSNDGLNALYDVDFQASLRLEEQPTGSDESGNASPSTSVSWDLDLSVWIKLPKVITMLPEGLVQSSGDHLLRQIVRPDLPSADLESAGRLPCHPWPCLPCTKTGGVPKRRPLQHQVV